MYKSGFRKFPKVLIGGCFDLIHVGHIHVLSEASKYGLVLVAVLSDRYIQSYKGKDRPIINEEERLAMVSAIKWVTDAFICDEDAYSNEMLTKIRPDIVIIGKENAEKRNTSNMIQRIKNVLENVRVVEIERFKSNKISTTKIINHIRQI